MNQIKAKLPLSMYKLQFKLLPYQPRSLIQSSQFSTIKPSLKEAEIKQERKLTEEEIEMLKPMLRVNQAGEIGANFIYMGQLAVFRNDPKLRPLIQHMWEQEKVHLEKFNELVGKYQVRPTALTPVWKVAGFALGMTTALMGKEAAMACTEAVETVIGQHYNDQLRDLSQIKIQEIDQLRKTIREFRDDELEHLDTAIDHDAQKAPFYSALTTVIQTGCKAAIFVASRV